MDLTKSFAEHIKTLQKRTADALGHWHFDRLVIDAGSPYTYFSDDRNAIFVGTPHFRHWCPVNAPHHLIEITAGKKPRLIYFRPDDFWHEKKPLGNPYWASEFEIVEVGGLEAIWRSLTASSKSTAYIGPHDQIAEQHGFHANPARLVSMLDWNRSFKTPYEIECTSEATRLAAKGHLEAKRLFEAGASELEIHYGYVSAVGCTESELPYGTIIALNEKSAILHYEYKRSDRNGSIFLIDAGAKYESYCSDITRTYCNAKAVPEFRAILEQSDQLQLRLCQMSKPGTKFAELHHESHVGIAKLLIDNKVIQDTTAEGAVDAGITRAFFPHGLGHQLGIQVHDVGGQQSDPFGSPCVPPPQYPKLRSTRTLAPGMLFTIEPGIYFIPMLLNDHRTGSLSKHFNWKLIDRLIPFGGIRIEDDIVVTDNGFRNLTREHLPH
jgi:Xaa-Pro dipeptidase